MYLFLIKVQIIQPYHQFLDVFGKACRLPAEKENIEQSILNWKEEGGVYLIVSKVGSKWKTFEKYRSSPMVSNMGNTAQ